MKIKKDPNLKKKPKQPPPKISLRNSRSPWLKTFTFYIYCLRKPCGKCVIVQ